MLPALPVDVTAMILEHLPLKERCGILCVCTALWRSKYRLPCVFPTPTFIWYRLRMDDSPVTIDMKRIAEYGNASLSMVRCMVRVMQLNTTIAPVDRALSVLHCLSQPIVHARPEGRRWYKLICQENWWRCNLPEGVDPVVDELLRELFQSRPSRTVKELLQAKLSYCSTASVDPGQLHLFASLHASALQVTAGLNP